MPYLAFGVPDLMRRAGAMLDLQKKGYRMGANVALFSAIAAECFLSDFMIACKIARLPWEAAGLNIIADLLDEMEENRLPIRTKYAFLYYTLTRNGIPKGDVIYQDFDLLIEVRDALAHYKSYSMDSTTPSLDSHPPRIQKLVTRLATRRVIEGDAIEAQWTNTLDKSADFAEWALKSASGIMRLIVEAAPKTESGILQRVLRTFYHED